MSLILDGLYDQHVRYLNNNNIEKVINDFAEANPNSTRDLYNITNIVKTSAVCGYTYRKCYEKIRKTVASIVIPDSVVAAIVKFIHNPNNKRDIYREVAAYKHQVSESMVTDEMIEEIKNVSFDSYSINEEPVEDWDEYFYNICVQIARHSKCLSRRIGALLVKDKRIIAAGYNGPASGIARCDQRWRIDPIFAEKYKDKVVIDKYTNDSSFEQLKNICPRRAIGAKSGEYLEMCPAVHSEENAILMCARSNAEAKDATMYMTCGIPCKLCMNKIIQVGIKEIVVTTLAMYDDTSLYLLENSNVKVRLFDFIK